MNTEIVFLILNYETYWETVKCVGSIYKTIGFEKIGEHAHKIVIVDNGSKNDSWDKLCRNYAESAGIFLLHSDENLGFARGNNIGFRFAKEHLKPDFVVMINSDIVMTDEKFEEKLNSDFERFSFDVAGPDVVLPDGRHLNPPHSKLLDLEFLEKRIGTCKRDITLCKWGIEPFIKAFKRITRKLEKPVKHDDDPSQPLDLTAGVQLHGCFLIFAKSYIEKFDGIYDKTFLYGEEALLRLRCGRAGMKMYFLKDIDALHNESRTESFVYGNIRKRHLVRNKNTLNSLYVIKEYMENGNLL